MHSPGGLTARQTLPLASALALTLLVPTGAVAQDATPAASAPPAPEAVEAPVAAGKPSRFKAADIPRGGLGMAVRDVIEGGPGYIAAGGGSASGLDARPIIWVSDDGMHWQSVPLFGDAVQGFVEGLAAIPAGGYVAVGRDFAPSESTEGPIVTAVVWRSDDGIAWDRIPDDETFPGSVMYDVTTTPDGVAAVGCQADFHCNVGRVWTSGDGVAWEMTDGIGMAPFTVAAAADDIVLAGVDDGWDIVLGQATVASMSEEWTPRSLASPKSQFDGSTSFGDGVAVAGWLADPDGPVSGAAVRASEDGIEWSLVEPKPLKGAYASGISAAGDLVFVVGQRYDLEKDITVPIATWSRDMETFESVKFPKKTGRNGLDLADVRITADGDMAIVVGSEAGRPAIWYSTIE